MSSQATPLGETGDIERNETTTRRQNSSATVHWISLLHQRNGLAWNKDYLLGQWRDAQIFTPAMAEVQLRIILRDVDHFK
jgi:hypothetical protein